MRERGGIVVVGSHVQGLFMRVDHFPNADETVLGWDFQEALDGGKGSHQAIACARLGAPTSFVGSVGADRLGDRGMEWMREAGVDLTYLFRSEKVSTGVGFVMIDPQGMVAITSAFGANGELSREHIDRSESLIASKSVMLVTFEIPVPVALYATQVGRRNGLTVVLTPAPAELFKTTDLQLVDILVPNETELKILVGNEPQEELDIEELAWKAQRRYGIQMIVITRGALGVSVLEGENFYHVPAVPVDVIDTPGAGDAFTAGMSVALLAGHSLREAVRFGCMTGAHAVSVQGSIPAFPTTQQIKTFATARELTIPAGVV